MSRMGVEVTGEGVESVGVWMVMWMGEERERARGWASATLCYSTRLYDHGPACSASRVV